MMSSVCYALHDLSKVWWYFINGLCYMYFLYDAETSELVANMVKDVRATEPERFQVAMSAVPAESALRQLFPDGF